MTTNEKTLIAFRDDAEKLEDKSRRESLRAHKERLNWSIKDIQAELCRISDVFVSYYTIRSWLADQDAHRARKCPCWVIEILLDSES